MNQNKRIGWIICESSNDEPLGPTKLVEKNGRRVIGEGRLQRANRKNRNGRYYDDKELFPQLVCARTKELLKTGFGSENGHPMSKDLVRQQTIDPNNVVAYFLKLWTDGDYIMGNFRGSNLPIGEAFDQDLRDGFLPAWSLRALGGIEETSKGAEVKGVKVITWDRVYYPSHPEAYTLKVVGESAGYGDNSIYVPSTPTPTGDTKLLESGIVTPITNQAVIDYIKEESCNFKQICNEFEVLYDDIQLIDEGTRVQLSNSSTGNMFIVQLENYIKNEIMDYCNKMY
jgi:hypothetical protein